MHYSQENIYVKSHSLIKLESLFNKNICEQWAASVVFCINSLPITVQTQYYSLSTPTSTQLYSHVLQTNYIDSSSQLIYKMDVLKNFWQFTRKQLQWVPFFGRNAEIRLPSYQKRDSNAGLKSVKLLRIPNEGLHWNSLLMKKCFAFLKKVQYITIK